MIALQRMLVQYENDNVYLLPSWPKDWDVHFKVNTPNNTTIEGVFKNGKMVKMKVTASDTKNQVQIISTNI